MRHYTRTRRYKPRSRPRGRLDSLLAIGHTHPVTQRDPKRLAAALRQRRSELGLSQAEFAARSGLAMKTVQRVESGSITPRGKTLGLLDVAADWKPGRALRILEGSVNPDSTPAADPEPLSPDWWLTLRRALREHPQLYAEVAEYVHLGQKAKAEGDQAAHEQ